MKPISSSLLLLLCLASAQLWAGILVTGVKTDGVDASYGADASNLDLVNAGASSLVSTTFSAAPTFGSAAHNNGTVGAANTTADITFWLNAIVGSTRSITYALDTSANALGYDINSIQTIHGWTGNSSGYQKNQNYEVFVSTVGSPTFTSLATVAYNPYTTANNTASTKVNITESDSGPLVTGVDEIRFTYTISGGGTQPSPTIREIDVFGVPSVADVTNPTVSALSPADGTANVLVGRNLVITFNEIISIGSGEITIKNLDAASQISIPVADPQVSVSGRVLTINPATDLDLGTNYAIQIAATAIDDLAGNSFAGINDDTTWNFATSGVLISTDKTDGVDAAYSADASNSDLVNVGSSSLASTIFSATPTFGSAAHNNGTVGAANTTADITFWSGAVVGQTYSITYSLNTTVNTLGYNLSSIQTIHGWTGASSGYQKNQNYEVFVSTVGSPTFTSLATVAYNPYTTANNTASTKVTINENDAGLLATGIDEIRFTYTITGGGTQPSPTIREIDVIGAPVPLGPDLTSPTFITLSPPDDNTAVAPDSNLVVTFNEPVIIGSGDITIKNLDAPSQIAIAVGDTQISVSGTVLTINPSANLTPNTRYAIQIAATAIDDLVGNSFNGIVNDTIWNFTTTSSVVTPLVVSSPVMRQVVQRNAANLGSIPVGGIATADRVEARAVSNSTTTSWQTITTNPSGAFSGSLTGVPAGGWYSIEVRTITAETPLETITVNMVGVGDIYVTAGQSNSANHGGPAATPTDDRVVARSSITTNAWVAAADPLPIATGTGGSAWSRLGELLAGTENIPIGFIAIGVGSTQVSQWVPGTSHYNTRLKPALQSLPLNGFRAVLWHQGESDSIAGVSAATHAGRLNSMISQSRIDAGWNVPWYLAEASFHPSSSLVAEERVAAGQRSVANTDALTFLGPSTDEFHLEDATGGKLSDSVHFNAAGLLDHATQWRDILLGSSVITSRNSGFENNRTPSITNLVPLADGASHIVAIAGNNDSPMVLDWRILVASGVEAADGNNGFHNPTTGTFAAAIDTTNGGVLPNMEGPHVAMLDGGSAGNYFLQSTRVPVAPNTTHTLTVALGVRDNPSTFGNALLEITSNGVVVASASFNKVALDILRGSDATGAFTNASVSWTTGNTVANNSLLAIRIVKEGGAGTVLDFDKVRFTSKPNTFGNWIDGFDLAPTDKDFEDDPDRDGLANGIEAWFGTDPSYFNAGLTNLSINGSTTTFTHPRNANPPVDIGGAYYDWSEDLINWFPSGSGPNGGPTVTFVALTVGTSTSVTATASAALEKMFLRVRTIHN